MLAPMGGDGRLPGDQRRDVLIADPVRRKDEDQDAQAEGRGENALRPTTPYNHHLRPRTLRHSTLQILMSATSAAVAPMRQNYLLLN